MKKKSKFLNICFSVASFIILLIFVTNIITVLGWLIKIPISKYHLLLAFIATTILNYYLQFRYKNISKYEYIVSMGIAILCFGFSLYIANLFLDISYDGGWYHSISIIRLADGWNPIYEFVNSINILYICGNSEYTIFLIIKLKRNVSPYELIEVDC